MRLVIFTIFLFLNLLMLQAQNALPPRCPYKDIRLTDSRVDKLAEDFTITTTDGISRNLYNTLDSGKTVFIDLFYTTCTYCQLYAPVIEEVYQATGAGEGDIEFWGISNNLFDTNWVIDQYKENYNVSNPCAGPWGGGLSAFSTIVEGQNFYGFPTYCVICPDRYMYFNVCYPPVAECFYPYFENCAVGIPDEQTSRDQTGIISVFPNPAGHKIFLEISLKSMNPFIIEAYNLPGRRIFSDSYEARHGIQTVQISTALFQNGLYFIKLIQDDQLMDIREVLVSRP